MWEYWGYCGEIESLDLMRFPDTGRFKGICFITFKTVSSYTLLKNCQGNLILPISPSGSTSVCSSIIFRLACIGIYTGTWLRLVKGSRGMRMFQGPDCHPAPCWRELKI